MNTRTVGAYYEGVAARYLEGKGYRVLARNFRCRQGEIDIVALDGRTIVFVEVKYRRRKQSGYPEEAVTRQKQRVISRTADFFFVRYKIRTDTPCRFDCVAIDGEAVRHYQNAFAYISSGSN